MKMKRYIAFIILFSTPLYATQICSRVALVNGQEVLVDTISTKKGEGLRYHLAKDEISMNYLDKYQAQQGINWRTSALGTAGSTLILAGFFTNSSSNNDQRLIVGGIALIMINFLVANTLNYTNEENFNRAIEEYNKRNIPKIVLKNIANDELKGDKPSLMLEKSWGF
jgi:hypothetical protein